MKRKHEAKFLKLEVLRKHPSALNIVIGYIGNKIIEELIINYTDETIFMTGGCKKVFDGVVEI